MTEKQRTELEGLLGVIFVVNAEHGPKVLFRYPHDVDNRSEDPSVRPGVFKRGALQSQDPPVLNNKSLLDCLRDSSLESLLIPKTPEYSCHRPFIVSIDNLVFLGYPFQPHTDLKFMYNIVFVVEKGTKPYIMDSLINLSTRMSVALAYEERNHDYITDNIVTIDKYYREADIPTKEHINPNEMDEQEKYIVERCPFREMIEEPNSLAANLSQVFDSIKENLSARVVINKTINFSFFIEPFEAEVGAVRNTVAPFESFVILEEAADIKQNLNHDSCPSLIKLLDLPRPYFRSLKDISFSIDVDYDEIVRAVLALVRWRKALVVYPIVSTNEYMVSHTVSISQYHDLCGVFEAEFPGFSFYEELSKFSVRKSLSEILDCFKDKDTIDTYKLIVVWFLRRKLLVQLFAHVYIKPAHDTNNELSAQTPSFTMTDLRDSIIELEEESCSPDPSPSKKTSYAGLNRGGAITDQTKMKYFRQYLSPHQFQRLKELPGVDSYNFAKVLPHAHAGRTFEEILWRTNLLQQDLHDIIYRTFSEFLITVRHPTSIY